MHGTIDTFAERLIAARSIAKTREECAAMVCRSVLTLKYHFKKLGLPHYPRVVRRFHEQETLDRVCAMYAAGDSITIIGREMNLTRGQVAGILDRFNMFEKHRRPKRAAKRQYPSRRKARIPNDPKFKPISFRARVAPVESLNLEFEQLNTGQCRYSTSGDSAGEYRFCGHPAEDRYPGSYCAAHAAIAYVSPQARNREARPR